MECQKKGLIRARKSQAFLKNAIKDFKDEAFALLLNDLKKAKSSEHSG